MYTIKKYANGRFYDTEAKKYVTQPELLKLQKAGKKLNIVETKTGKDITADVMDKVTGGRKKTTTTRKPAAKKSRTKAQPDSVFAQLIKKGGDSLSDYGKKYSDMLQNMVTMSREEIDKLVNRLVKDNKISQFEADKFKKELQRHRENVEGWFSKTIDRRVNEVLGRMNLANRDQIVSLTAKIDALSKKISDMEKKKSAAKSGTSKTGAKATDTKAQDKSSSKDKSSSDKSPSKDQS